MEDELSFEPLGYEALGEGVGGYSTKPEYNLPGQAVQPVPYKPWLQFTRPKDKLNAKIDYEIRRSQEEDDKARVATLNEEYKELTAQEPGIAGRIKAALSAQKAPMPELQAPEATMGEGIAQIVMNLLGKPVGHTSAAMQGRMNERNQRENANAMNKWQGDVRDAGLDMEMAQFDLKELQRKIAANRGEAGELEDFWRKFDADLEMTDRKQKGELEKIDARNEGQMAIVQARAKNALELLEAKEGYKEPAYRIRQLMELGFPLDVAQDMVFAKENEAIARTKEREALLPGKIEGQKVDNNLKRQRIDESKAKIANWNASIRQRDERLGFDIEKWVSGESDTAPDTKEIAKDISKLRAKQASNKGQMQALEREILAMPKPDKRSDAQIERVEAIRQEQAKLRTENAGIESELKYLDSVRKSTSPKANAPDGGYSHPVTGRVSSGFGARAKPNARASTNHGGMDFAVPSGTPVKAARDGVVIRVQGNVGNAGDIIVVRHRDGSTTHYFHLSGFSVKAGQQVKQGQVIGKSGATGNVTGPHLHFEIRDSKGNKINPGKILK